MVTNKISSWLDNNLNQKLWRENQAFKNESVDSFLKKLSNDKINNYSLWKATKQFNSAYEKKTGTGYEATKRRQINAYLEQIFQPNKAKNRTQRQENTVTPKELEKRIKTKIDSWKAPGFDLISEEILKQLPKMIS